MSCCKRRNIRRKISRAERGSKNMWKSNSDAGRYSGLNDIHQW